MRKNIFFILISITIYFHSYGQEWRNGDTKKSFHQIQKEFNEYWKDKEPTKGSGYKQFKRWEYYWENRLMPDGSFPPVRLKKEKYTEYQRLLSKNKSELRTGNVNWESEGPETSTQNEFGIGRLNCIALHPTNNDIIFVGTWASGIWKSIDGGNSWQPKMDYLGLGVSTILIHPNNPNIMYLASGDGNQSFNFTNGIYKSQDGGNNWSHLNLTFPDSTLIRKMIFNPLNPDSIFIASDDGLYAMTNSGMNLNIIQEGNFFDIEANTNISSHIIYSATNNKIF